MNRKGVEDNEARELLTQYSIQCEQEFESRFPDDLNRAHFECALSLALLYGKTDRYKAYAIESLEELLEGAPTLGFEKEREVSDQIRKLRSSI